MNKLIYIFVALMLSLVAQAATYSVEQVPNVHKADRTRFTTNPDGILSAQAQAQLDSLMSRLRRTTSVEMVTVVVDDIDDSDIDNYANRLFDHWGLGKKDINNGLLLLIAKDSHGAVIRTGPGLEGVLTDMRCGQILRHLLFPALREGDFDGGVYAAAQGIAAVLGDPESIEEVKSQLDDVDEEDDIEPFTIYVWLSIIITLLMALCIGFELWNIRRKSPYDKYTAFESWRAPVLVLTAAGMFIPLVVSLPFLLMLNHWRNKPRLCPNCQHKMVKIDEVHDNDFLTPSQDAEERVGSVDYDVWHCENCGETDVYPFVNKAMPLTECSVCHARTAKLVGDKVLVQPTSSHKGVGVKEFTCLNCHNKTHVKYDIAKLPPVIIVPMGGGRGFGGGGGGGSIGGGFGGGFTGGGGASGHW